MHLEDASKGHLALLEPDAIERLRDQQREVDGLVRGEVLAQLLLVDGEALAAHLLLVVAHVPALDLRLGERLAGVLRLVGAQLLDLLLLELRDRGFHVAEELRDHLRRAHHLAAQHVVREGRQVVEPGQLLAQHEDLVEEVEVLRPALGELGEVVPLPRRLLPRVLHERHVGRVLEGEDVVAVLVLRVRMALQVRLGHPLHLRGREGDPRGIVAHVAVVGLAQLLELVEDLLGALALGRRQGHAAVLEAFHGVLAQLGLDRVGRLRGAHAPEDLLVLVDLGRDRRVFLQARLGRVAHRLVGVHAAQEIDGPDVLQADLQAVPFVEDAGRTLLRLHDGDRLARARERGLAGLGDAGRVHQRHEGALGFLGRGGNARARGNG